jgi:hypothetical protein
VRRATGDERVWCPACALTLPLALLGPRHCPRCASQRHDLVKLEPYAAGVGGAARLPARLSPGTS